MNGHSRTLAPFGSAFGLVADTAADATQSGTDLLGCDWEGVPVVVHLDTVSEAPIRQNAMSGRYGEVADVVREALRLLDERDRTERLRALIAEGVAAAERGEFVALTPELLDQVTREVEELARLGRQPSPDVCP